jgi:hypothetical protein
VEPQPPSSSAPPPPPVPPAPSRADGGGSKAPVPPSAPPPNIEILICPVCREPRAEDARFCEECGHDYGGGAVPPVVEERPVFSGPVLWAILLFWVALAIGGLFFLYTALWAI